MDLRGHLRDTHGAGRSSDGLSIGQVPDERRLPHRQIEHHTEQVGIGGYVIASVGHDDNEAVRPENVDAVFTAIADAAAKGEEIALNGFGKFKVKNAPAREGRNPSTGETIQIAASRKLSFAPAKAVKDKLNA